jgi:hypothetical protein
MTKATSIHLDPNPNTNPNPSINSNADTNPYPTAVNLFVATDALLASVLGLQVKSASE